MSSRVSTLKLKPILITLLATTIIVACQSNIVRQPTHSQLANCRTVQHALGKVCVPQTSQRLVALDEITLADALALGVPLIGAAISDGVEINYLIEHTENREGIELLSQSDQPNLEEILKFKPDLIMGLDWIGEPIFSQLSQIAPTAVGKWRGHPSWREHFNFVARVLDKEAEAQQVWDSYYQQIFKIKTALGSKLKGIKVSTVYAWQGVNISTTNSFISSILTDLDIRQPTYAVIPANGIITLSEEAIPDIDADILFVSVYNTESEKVLADWQQKPLWKKLKSVQEGRVYVVNANIWEGGNPIAANLVLDDLFKYLVNAEVPSAL
jgi:iron complex transport system substrate-binding protein